MIHKPSVSELHNCLQNKQHKNSTIMSKQIKTRTNIAAISARWVYTLQEAELPRVQPSQAGYASGAYLPAAISESLAPTDMLVRIWFLWCRHLKEPGWVVGEQRQLNLTVEFSRRRLGEDGVELLNCGGLLFTGGSRQMSAICRVFFFFGRSSADILGSSAILDATMAAVKEKQIEIEEFFQDYKTHNWPQKAPIQIMHYNLQCAIRHHQHDGRQTWTTLLRALLSTHEFKLPTWC